MKLYVALLLLAFGHDVRAHLLQRRRLSAGGHRLGVGQVPKVKRARRVRVARRLVGCEARVAAAHRERRPRHLRGHVRERHRQRRGDYHGEEQDHRLGSASRDGKRGARDDVRRRAETRGDARITYARSGKGEGEDANRRIGRPRDGGSAARERGNGGREGARIDAHASCRRDIDASRRGALRVTREILGSRAWRSPRRESGFGAKRT